MKKASLFDLGYILYFISLFISDINIADDNITLVIKLIKYTSYICFLCHIFSTNHYSVHNFLRTVLFIFFVGSIAFWTHDIYYSGICLIIFASLYENKYKILRCSFILLLICSMVVAILTIFGVLDNVLLTNTSGNNNRWGLGYYHSDVFPLIIFYLFSWRILIKRRLKFVEIILFIMLTLFAYIFCLSRNGLIICSILILYMCVNNKHIEKEKAPVLMVRLIYRNSILIMTVLSLILTVINGNYLSIVYKINVLFSGRFALAYHKMNDVGLHIINFMSDDIFKQSQYVLDNGYMYVILRYGLAFMLFYIYIQYLICKKYDNRTCFIFMVTSIACMVDNDLFSYGFLPYILLAFNQKQNDYLMIKKENEISKASVRLIME